MIAGLGRSPGEGKGEATHSRILAWRTGVHGVAKRWTRHSDFHFHIEKLQNEVIAVFLL